MFEYIKRTSAMTVCERYSQHCFEQNDSHGQDIADRIFDDIVELPTKEVIEVKHGEWIYVPETYTLKSGYVCSVCKSTTWHSPDVPQAFKHCPDCTAKMDGERIKNK